MNAIVSATPASSVGLMPANIDQALRLADMMATAKLVPMHLQGKPGDCLLVIEQAMRWGMSPFAVAQATSVISGKLMFEGKLVSAAINASGILSSRMAYDFDGDGSARAVTASATIRGEKTPRTIRCTLAEAKTTNQLWTKQPDQQLVYFSTRAWARRHAPEVMLGVYAPEEFADQANTFTGQTIEAEAPAQSAPHKAMASAMAAPAAPKPRTRRDFLNELHATLDACHTIEEVDEIAQSDQVIAAIKSFTNGSLTELNALLAEAIDRTRPDPDHETAESVMAEGEG